MLLLASTTCALLNDGGIPYTISNPEGSVAGWKGTPGRYSTDFEENVGKVEHFDVYGEVQTRYSQVYWTRNAPIDLPPALVKRFAGKVIAITGYEVDQVTSTSAPPPNGTAGPLSGFACYPECDGTDASVPIYHAYNHHYFSWLTGEDAELVTREEVRVPNPTKTAFRSRPSTSHKYPTSIVYKENPGGEFRKSYHGYPRGFAQLLHSPTQWVVEPMQIDTHNRAIELTDASGPHPSFLPRQLSNASQTDLRSKLSPLIECPCSTRILKTVTMDSALLTAGRCPSPIAHAADCTAAVARLAPVGETSTVHDRSQPAGCQLLPSASVAKATAVQAAAAPKYDAVFNAAATSTAACGQDGPVALSGTAPLANLTTVSIAHDGTTATITLAGPADGNWWGVGFGATTMAERPYAIIVDGSGAVSERQLGEHAPGEALDPQISVVSNTAADGVRTVVLTRAVWGHDEHYYSIPTKAGLINVVTAVGSTPALAYHQARTSGTLALLPTEVGACVCGAVPTTHLSYMNKSAIDFQYTCSDEPRSDMLRKGDGTGKAVQNAACSMDTYHGGLQCCKHTWFLTDAEDDARIPPQVDRYFLKWRYYFQEYTPAQAGAPPSHRHLHHWVFLIDDAVNDYEEAETGSPTSMGKLSANLTAKQIGLEDTPANFTNVTLLVMTPHCHAPSCIREELWNADTGQILCNVSAVYGRPQYGPLTAVFNEEDYIAIPPCIFGQQAGLQFPWTLRPDTKLVAHKYFNNSYRHLGQMAQWTGLMVYSNWSY